MGLLKVFGVTIAGLLLAGLGILLAAGMGWFGVSESPGVITRRAVPGEVVAARADAQDAAARAVGAATDGQILFGDLHVHTTFSVDAFFGSLPALGGEGAHPPADACDFARYCSALDFWSINDHAEGLSADHWRETVESIRECNAVSGNAGDPDLVSFLGWEWTQVGTEPANHYGHKNVVLRHTDAARIPLRPIASRGLSNRAMQGIGPLGRGVMAMLGGDARYHGLARLLAERRGMEDCPDGVPERDLPVDCFEATATPGELFAKLDDWGYDALVIPHGTTWGFYTPPGSTWDKQLTLAEHDPERQKLVEVYSGHGNSEEYRDFRGVELDADGRPSCPEPSVDYLPTCWRAGELIRARCLAAGESEAECESRAVVARQTAAEAGVQAFLTVPGATAAEWLDAGQCLDCFLPAFNYRPGGSVQYMLALRSFDGSGPPRRFHFGFMASSDNHTARPGTGYKEYARRAMTEALGPVSPEALGPFGRRPSEPMARAVPYDASRPPAVAFDILEAERQSSFFLTGGLVAVHAAGRDRDSIWQALERREVYGTSGPRILLWFDLLNDPAAPDGRLAMGGEARMATAPEFRVRAAGSLEQLPGCPDVARTALASERIERLCRGECFNPGDRRRPITRIEVVRIRPQNHPAEPVENLIEDPWRVLPCDPSDLAGCSATFSDPDFTASARDSLYYVRAIEAPSPAVNADNLRCARRDAAGRCLEVDPCWGDYRVDPGDDCLAETEERAWSSPIFVGYAAPG